MKKYIFKILGIPNFKKEIAELKTTINTLQNEATNTYKVYEDAFCFIKGLNIDKKENPWWDNVRYDGKNHEIMKLVDNIKRSQQVEFATKNPSLKIHKIFHGGCLECNSPLRQGIGVCTGCRYLMDGDYPNLFEN